MKDREFHLSDRELVLAMDGELADLDLKRVGSHLDFCLTCRSRKQDLERAMAAFVWLRGNAPQHAPSAGPRAMLKARLDELKQARI